MDRLCHKPRRAVFSALISNHAVVFLLLTRFNGGESQMTGQPQKIVVTLGNDIILPCHMGTERDLLNEFVEWSRADLDPRFVHMWRFQRDDLSDQNQAYKGRTSVSADNLKIGDASLKLSKVKVTDEGTYKCFVPGLKDNSIQLNVGAASSAVLRVVLQCESKGWYPEPELLWLDAEGKLLSAGPTETVRGPDVLYTVSSRVTVEKRHSNSFTCRVQQKTINQTRDTHIHVPDDFFKVQSTSPVIIGLAVTLAVSIIIILSLVFFVWTKRENIKTKRGQTDEEEREREKLMEEQKQDELHQLQEEKKKQEDEYQRQKTELETKNQQLETNQAETNRKKEEAERQVEEMKKEMKQKEDELQRFKGEKEKESEEEQSHIEQLETKIKQLEKQLQEQKEKQEDELQQLQDERKKREEEVETLKKKIIEMENQQKDLERQKKELETKNQQLKEQLQEEKKKLEDEHQRQKTDLETKNQQLETNQETNRTKEEAERQVEEMKKEMEEKLKQKPEELHQLQEEKKKQDEHQKQKTELETKNQQLKEQLQEEKKGDKAEEESGGEDGKSAETPAVPDEGSAGIGSQPAETEGGNGEDEETVTFSGTESHQSLQRNTEQFKS